MVVSTPLKNIENISQWEGLSHIFMENKKCLKPPTSIGNIPFMYPSYRCLGKN
jgi:hypothetical protein